MGPRGHSLLREACARTRNPPREDNLVQHTRGEGQGEAVRDRKGHRGKVHLLLGAWGKAGTQGAHF